MHSLEGGHFHYSIIPPTNIQNGVCMIKGAEKQVIYTPKSSHYLWVKCLSLKGHLTDICWSWLIFVYSQVVCHDWKKLSGLINQPLLSCYLLYTACVLARVYHALHAYLTFVPWLTRTVSSSRGRRKQWWQWWDQLSVQQLQQLLLRSGQCSVGWVKMKLITGTKTHAEREQVSTAVNQVVEASLESLI